MEDFTTSIWRLARVSGFLLMSFQNGGVGEVTRNLHESHNEILFMFFRSFPLVPTDAARRKQC